MITSNNQLSQKFMQQTKRGSLLKEFVLTLIGFSMVFSYVENDSLDIIKFGFYGLMLFLSVIIYISSNKKIHFSVNIVLLILYFIWTLLSSIYTINSIDITYYINKTVTILFFITVFLLNIQSNIDIKKIIGGYIIGVVFSIIYVLINEYSLILNYSITTRIGESFGAGVTFSKILLTSLILYAFYSFNEIKLYHVVLMIISIFFMILSQTRKSIVLLVIYYGVIVLGSTMPKKIKKRIILIGILLSIIFVMILVSTTYGQGLLQRFFDFFAFDDGRMDSSRYYRNQFIINGWKFFQLQPLFGFGVDSFSYLNYYYGNGVFLYSHNVYIETIVNFGIVGFILLFAPLIFTLLRLVSSKRKTEYINVSIAIIIVIIIDGWFSITTTSVVDMFLIFLVYYYASSGRKMVKNTSIKTPVNILGSNN